MSGHRKKAMLALAAASLAATLAPGCSRGRRTVVERAVPRDVVCQRENRHQHGGQPARVSTQSELHVQLALRVRCLHCHRGRRSATKKRVHPRPIEYTWNGTQWVREISWQWDCLLPDGTIEYAPAKSITAYTPGQYGILTGVFHTDIASGTCKGNVDMPVSAKPIVG